MKFNSIKATKALFRKSSLQTERCVNSLMVIFTDPHYF